MPPAPRTGRGRAEHSLPFPVPRCRHVESWSLVAKSLKEGQSFLLLFLCLPMICEPACSFCELSSPSSFISSPLYSFPSLRITNSIPVWSVLPLIFNTSPSLDTCNVGLNVSLRRDFFHSPVRSRNSEPPPAVLLPRRSPPFFFSPSSFFLACLLTRDSSTTAFGRSFFLVFPPICPTPLARPA